MEKLKERQLKKNVDIDTYVQSENKEKKQNKNFYKNQNGSITLFILLSCLFFLIVVVSVSAYLKNKETAIDEQYYFIKNRYEQDVGKEESIYEENNRLKGLPSAKGTTPYLPTSDYSQVAGTNLSTGLVIEDNIGNQYVWIEVPNDGSGPNYTSVASKTEGSKEYYQAIASAMEVYAGDYTKGSYDETFSGWTEEWYDRCNMTWDGTSSYALVKNVASSSYYNTAKTYYSSLEKDLYTTSDCTTVATAKSSSGLYVKIEGKDDVLLQDTQGCGLTYEGYNNLYKAMLTSVYKNGGFWIGRYEVGDSTITTNIENGTSLAGRTDSSGTGNTAVIKANQIPYTYVKCYEAQEIAKTFAKSGNSSLLFGIQWDLVMKFLEVKNVATYAELASGDGVGSKNWGNYYDNLWTITNTSSKSSTDYGANWVNGAYGDKGTSSKSILLSTAADKSFAKMNIYDLAGNVLEWTLEHATYSAHYPCAGRGGGYDYAGSNYPASFRDVNGTTYSYGGISFRVALY